MGDYLCPFMQGKPCSKVRCALYYDENDTCALYQIAINSENISDNLASAALNLDTIAAKLEGK